jgi:hypothetical protein
MWDDAIIPMHIGLLKHINSNTKDTQLSFSSFSLNANDIIWFVDNSYRMNEKEIAVPLSEMLRQTSTKGFSCGSQLRPRFAENGLLIMCLSIFPYNKRWDAFT